MTNLLGCKCSEDQLHHVGCECDLVTVVVWERGYAEASGRKTFVAAWGLDPQEYASEARRQFGPSATVYSINSDVFPAAAPTAGQARKNAEMARYYTQGDNS